MLKMNQLVKLTDTPKSTILYYIKEGLLPQPEKPKPNVHLYDESFIEKIKFIKYLQKNFNLTIEQLKNIMQRDIFSYTNLIDILDLLMEPPTSKRYSLDELSNITNTDKEQIKSYIKRGLIFDRGNGFSDKEAEIIDILNRLASLEGGDRLIEIYKSNALNISKAEIDTANELEAKNSLNEDSIKSLFDATLILKPYLLNMTLYTLYKRDLK